jgi:hypothetical protein
MGEWNKRQGWYSIQKAPKGHEQESCETCTSFKDEEPLGRCAHEDAPSPAPARYSDWCCGFVQTASLS